MGFNVQDDAGSVASANSYVTEAYFNSYHNDRGNESLLTYGSPAIKSALVKSTDHIDFKFEKRFGGERLLTTQTTSLPRKYFYDIYSKDFSSQIPDDIKKAVCEYAKVILNSESGDLEPDPVYDETGQNIKSKTEKIDGAVMESIVYKDDFILSTERKYPKADRYVDKYLTKSNGNSYSLLRA